MNGLVGSFLGSGEGICVERARRGSGATHAGGRLPGGRPGFMGETAGVRQWLISILCPSSANLSCKAGNPAPHCDIPSGVCKCQNRWNLYLSQIDSMQTMDGCLNERRSNVQYLHIALSFSVEAV